MKERLLLNLSNRNCVGSHLVRLCRGCDSIEIAVAFVLKSGAATLLDALKRHGLPARSVTFITGTAFHVTDPAALDLLRRKGVRLRLFTGKRIFHPKVYCFRRGREAEIVVGSANLSAGGFSDNIEASLGCRLAAQSLPMQEWSQYYHRLLQDSVPATERWIAAYGRTRKPRPYSERGRRIRPPMRLANRRTRSVRQRRVRELAQVRGDWRRHFDTPRAYKFSKKCLVFTGIFNGMTHDECERQARKLRAEVDPDVVDRTDVLVRGSGGNPNYLYGDHGIKIADAIRRRGNRKHPMLWSEETWDRLVKNAKRSVRRRLRPRRPRRRRA